MLQIVEIDASECGTAAELWTMSFPLHPISAPELERQMRLEPPLNLRTWIAYEAGDAVGVGSLEHNAGSYHPDQWIQYVAVRPDRRGRGIGQAIWQQVTAEIPPTPLSIETRIHEGDAVALRFAGRRGFHEVKRDFESELVLGSAASPEARAIPGVTCASLAEVESDALRRELHRVFEEVRKDIPRTDPPIPMSFQRFEELVLDEPELIKAGSQLAFFGSELIGYSTVFASPSPGTVSQGLTAVVREHRGKGVAMALKLRVIDWAKASGFRTIRTDNDTRNAPMLAINEKLGFRRLAGMITMRWEA